MSFISWNIKILALPKKVIQKKIYKKRYKHYTSWTGLQRDDYMNRITKRKLLEKNYTERMILRDRHRKNYTESHT